MILPLAAQTDMLSALICLGAVKIIHSQMVANEEIESFQVKSSWCSISELCPANPMFMRLESDVGYFRDSTVMTDRPFVDALEYCRTNFETPAFLPNIKTIESLTEATAAIHFLHGETI